jgi:hypothetical protein
MIGISWVLAATNSIFVLAAILGVRRKKPVADIIGASGDTDQVVTARG